MGWRAVYRDGTEKNEENSGRPVQDGDEGKLALIAQEDYGNKVAVDLINGIIHIGYDHLDIESGQIIGAPVKFWICEDSNIVGMLAHHKEVLSDYRDENGRRVINEEGRITKVRTDVFTPLLWRPIWFSRVTNGDYTKVIGAQTTTPTEFGGRNVKKMVFLFSSGDIGID
jgi:hypothetical protein